MAQQPIVGQGPLIIEASRSHSDTTYSLGLLWKSDWPVAKKSFWQVTTLARERERHSCRRRNSNPQTQQASGRGPTS